MEPSVRIEARCKNGHETYMYPEDCLQHGHYMDEEDYCVISWECARCPIDNFKCEVEL
jgi:hypothetical protein